MDMSKSTNGGEASVSFEGGQLYNWVCPICNASKIGTAEQTDPLTSGLFALQSHIRATEGGGHGTQHSIPAEWTDETLRQCVEGNEL